MNVLPWKVTCVAKDGSGPAPFERYFSTRSSPAGRATAIPETIDKKRAVRMVDDGLKEALRRLLGLQSDDEGYIRIASCRHVPAKIE